MVFDFGPRDEDYLWRRAGLTDPAGNLIFLYVAGRNRRFPPWRIARLAAITPLDIDTFAHDLAASGRAPSTVANILAPLRALLADAYRKGLIRSNPAAGMRLPTGPRANAPGRDKALTADQLRAVIEATPESWKLFVRFLAHTGLRIGECVALTWADIDLGKKHVHVSRRIYRGQVDTPKSRYGTASSRSPMGSPRSCSEPAAPR